MVNTAIINETIIGKLKQQLKTFLQTNTEDTSRARFKMLMLIEYYFFMLDEYMSLTEKDEATYKAIINIPRLMILAMNKIINKDKSATSLMKQIHHTIWECGVANIGCDFDTFDDFIMDSEFEFDDNFTQYSLQNL